MVIERLVYAAAVWAVATAAAAQPPEPAPPKPVQPAAQAPNRQLPTATLMVEVTVNRMSDGKKVTSVPYVLAVSPDGPRSTLRIGGEVPIPTTISTPGKEGAGIPPAPYTYRSVGTNIDVTAMAVGDGSYRLNVTLEESSVYPPAEAEKSGMTASPAVRASGAPAFRSLRASNAFTVRDGQTFEFSAGSDLISGETARIAVKVTVVK